MLSDFPTNSQKFGKKLTAISALLFEVGINIKRSHRESQKRQTLITYTPDVAPEQVASDVNNEALAQESASDNVPDID